MSTARLPWRTPVVPVSRKPTDGYASDIADPPEGQAWDGAATWDNGILWS